MTKKEIIENIEEDDQFFDNLDEEYKNDKDIILAKISSSGDWNISVPNEFRLDRKFIIDIMYWESHLALHYADKSLQENKKFVLDLVELDYNAFLSAPDILKKDKQFILEVVDIEGEAILFVDDDLKKNKDVVLRAVRNNGYALDFVDDSMKKDKTIIFEAIKQNAKAFSYADISLKSDIDFALKVVKEDINALTCVDSSIAKEVEELVRASEESMNIQTYLSKLGGYDAPYFVLLHFDAEFSLVKNIALEVIASEIEPDDFTTTVLKIEDKLIFISIDCQVETIKLISEKIISKLEDEYETIHIAVYHHNSLGEAEETYKWCTQLLTKTIASSSDISAISYNDFADDSVQ